MSFEKKKYLKIVPTSKIPTRKRLALAKYFLHNKKTVR
jgi:hypothetical protein